MPNQTQNRLALCVLLSGAIAASCVSTDPGAEGTGGMTGAGGTATTGTGGAIASGTGGANNGTGGKTSTGTGGITPISTGGTTSATGGAIASTGGTTSSGGAIATTGGSGVGGRLDGSGGTALGGRGGGGGRSGPSVGGATGSGASTGAGGALAINNPPVPSAGCGKATTVTSGKKTITSSGKQRAYIIDIPADYDMNKPYRFFYTSHWISSTAEAVQQQNFYFLKPLATAAKQPAIFLAPQALPGDPNGTWSTSNNTDHILFDDLLAYVKANLCIDTTRVFATGFSFGGMMTYSLSVNHQKDIRAAVGIAAANYNIYVPPATHLPIAYMGTTGMSDTTCPWINSAKPDSQGGKWIAMEHAKDNGCTLPADIPTWKSGNHVCYDFEGCKAGYPVKACTFNGGHTNISNEGGTNWIATESWKFFTQF